MRLRGADILKAGIEKGTGMKGAASLAVETARSARAALVPAMSAVGVPQLVALGAFVASPLWGVPPELAFVALSGVLFVCGIASSLVGQAVAQGVPVPSAPFALMLLPRFWRYLAASFLPVGATMLAAAVAYLAFSLVQGLFVEAPASREEATMQALVALPAALAAGAWVHARLFLAMPHMAAGMSFSLSRSWRETRGAVWTLLAATVLTSVPLVALQVAVMQFPAEGAASKMALSVAIIAVSVAQSVVYGALGGAAARKYGRTAS